MGLAKNNGEIKTRAVSKKRLLISTTLLGTILLVVPITFLFFDPILYYAEYKLRLENGSMLHDLLTKEFVGPKLSVYLFNVTNADAFVAGIDKKIKLQDIGPFVYQEYRLMDRLEINREPGVMRYMPRLRLQLVPEESLAHPKDVYLYMPNVPFLSAVSMMGKNSYFIRQMFNIYAASLRSKAFIRVNAHDYLWGYPDKILQLANTVVPGLIYFNSTGLLERVYDTSTDYLIELGTMNADKFSMKKVSTFLLNKNPNVADKVECFKDTYEGAVYPPDMQPDTPIKVFRQGMCKTYQFQYTGRRRMSYGGDSFVYGIHNDTFNDRELCDSTGWCPGGLQNIAPCYFELPYAISKGHFLDADPRLLDMVEGLSPDRKKHDIETAVDPKIGVTISGSLSLQLNLFLANVSYNSETKPLDDMVLPLSHMTMVTPPMLEETKYALGIMYTDGPFILLVTNIVCTILGLALLAYSVRLVYWHWIMDKNNQIHEKLQNGTKPLLTHNTR